MVPMRPATSIPIMVICAVAPLLPERDTLARSVRGFAVNIAPVFCQAQALLFLSCPLSPHSASNTYQQLAPFTGMSV